jgi:hypothetical protein
MKPNVRFSPWTIAALLICAAVLLVCASALAQTVPVPQPGAETTPGDSNPNRSDPSTSTPSTISRTPDRAISEEGSRQSRSQDTDMSTAAERRPKVGREAKLGGVSAGVMVQNPAGDEIGRVKDIVPDAYTGGPAYIIIATRSGNTAVPNETIYPTYQNGHFVLDDSRLESAPRVSEKQLQDDKQDAPWKKEADRYWESRDRPSLE